MSGYDKMKETSHDLESDSPKLSVSMLRRIYEDKAKEVEKSSLKIERSMKESLNVEHGTASSETHDVKEKKIALLKAGLDSLGEQLSGLGRWGLLRSVMLDEVSSVKKIGEEIEKFDKEHSSYIYDNCKVDPALMDVRDQLAFLRGECKEKRVAMLKAELDFFGEQLSDLGNSHRFGLVRSGYVNRIRRIGEYIETFDKKHSSYIYDNCKVYPVIMAVLRQFESVRGEYKEKKAAMLKARLDILGKRLSDLDRSHQSSPGRLRSLRTMERLDADVKRFGEEHSSYIERNYEVDPALMGVRDQLESLRKELQEKRIAMLEEQVDSFTKQLNDLKTSLFSPSKLYSPSKDRLYPVLRDWHEQIQNAKLENYKTHKVLENIEKLQYKIQEPAHEIEGDISEFNKKYYDDLMKFASENTRYKYHSMMRDILECFNRFQSDKKIIDAIRNFKSGLDVKLKREVQAREEYQGKEQDEALGLDQLYREE